MTFPEPRYAFIAIVMIAPVGAEREKAYMGPSKADIWNNGV